MWIAFCFILYRKKMEQKEKQTNKLLTYPGRVEQTVRGPDEGGGWGAGSPRVFA